MADKNKKVAQSSDVEKATTEESAAAKVAKAAKGNTDKKDKPNFFVRTGKGTKKFFKDFKGECKKIVWPDAKTVLKSTGIVLLVVAIVGLIVYGIDQGLSAGIGGLKQLATGEEVTVSETAGDEHDHDHDHETEEDAAESEEKTTEAVETTTEKAEKSEEEATEPTEAE